MKRPPPSQMSAKRKDSGRSRAKPWVFLSADSGAAAARFRSGALTAARELGFDRVRIAGERVLARVCEGPAAAWKGRLGVIAALRGARLMRRLADARAPVILSDAASAALWRRAVRSDASVCAPDERDPSEAAAEYLCGQGRFASFAFVDGADGDARSRVCREAFAAALRARGEKAVGRIRALASAPDGQVGRLLAELRRLPKPTALFAGDDFVARELAVLCQAGGVGVPDDAAILGVGDEEAVCVSAPVGLSSVRVEYEQLGHAAMTRMIGMLCGATTLTPAELPRAARVVERDSTQAACPDNMFVQRALEYIATAPLHELNVTQIVGASGASRSYLEKRFHTLTGYTLLSRIQARRIDVVKRLLATSGKTVAAIADEVGFGSVSGLCALFSRVLGMTMSEYRRTFLEASAAQDDPGAGET